MAGSRSVFLMCRASVLHRTLSQWTSSRQSMEAHNYKSLTRTFNVSNYVVWVYTSLLSVTSWVIMSYLTYPLTTVFTTDIFEELWPTVFTDLKIMFAKSMCLPCSCISKSSLWPIICESTLYCNSPSFPDAVRVCSNRRVCRRSPWLERESVRRLREDTSKWTYHAVSQSGRPSSVKERKELLKTIQENVIGKIYVWEKNREGFTDPVSTP